MEIHKKTWPELFQKVLDGEKNFDVRLGDFEIHNEDVLILDEYDPEKKQYTGRSVKKKVSFVAKWKIGEIHSSEDIKKFGLNLIGLENDKKEKLENLKKEWKSDFFVKLGIYQHLVECKQKFEFTKNHAVLDLSKEELKYELDKELADLKVLLDIYVKEEMYKERLEKFIKNLEKDGK
ncbi:MAG: DUF3850 domain-containing protein [Nanoarchaeota archaeon]|nr:DUF3850 domain-containing protein [Nanoarchaeota archaeon]